MQMVRLIVIVLLAFPWLAACAYDNPYAFLPQPNKPGDKGSNRTATMVLSGHIVVEPVTGMDEEASRVFVNAVAESLLARGVIATASQPQQRTSKLVSALSEDGQLTLTYFDPYGGRLDEFSLLSPIGLDGNSAEGKLTLDALAGEIAMRLIPSETIDRVVSDAPSFAGADLNLPANIKPIIVSAIFGAPGDGGEVLKVSVKSALRQLGLDVVERPGPDVLQLQAMVSLTESARGYERLAISWELKEPQGKVLATIDQANDIPEGMLVGGWGELAGPITQGAATGILQYFQNAAAAN